MKLASEQEVLELFSLGTTTQNTDAVGAALEMATPIAEGIVGSDFARKVRFDRFVLTSEYQTLMAQEKRARFLLQDGFLTESRPKVYVSTERRIMRVSDDTTTLDRDYWLHDPVEGIVDIYDLPLGIGTQYSVAVKYECGFEVDSDDIAQDVPDWLKQAAISAANSAMQAHTRTHAKRDYRDMSDQLTRHLHWILNPHRRQRYGGVHPTMTVVE